MLRFTRPTGRGSRVFALAISLVAVAAGAAAPATDDLGAQLAAFRELKMPFDSKGLTEREVKVVGKLAEATRLLDALFWEQSDPLGYKMWQSLAGSPDPHDRQLRRLLTINGGRYNLIREYAPFGGAGPRPPGGSGYPAGLTRADVEAYVAKHPGERAAIYDPLTVIRRDGDRLVAIPYHVAYAKWLTPMAKALEEAAALTEDAAFAKFLRLRAKALLDDNYFESDLAWLALENPRIDVIFAPYETYLDNLLGVKGSYGASVLVRNEAESKKLDAFKKYVPEIQDALPLAAEDRPSKHGHLSPMEVMDAPVRGGDLRHGYQAVADNLPNDPRVHEAKGSKKIFFKNFLDARVNVVILPIARRLLRTDQVSLATADGYLTTTLMHEISHELGPLFARTPAGKRDIREAIGPALAGLEEAKATIVGLYGLKWLSEHGGYPASKLAECYVSEVVGIFRTVRFGVAEAHGRAEMMEFNYISAQGGIVWDAATGRYRVDVAAFATAVASLAKELLEQEATGDRARAHAWLEKYGTMPPTLATALAGMGDIPVDVDPVSDFPEP